MANRPAPVCWRARRSRPSTTCAPSTSAAQRENSGEAMLRLTFPFNLAGLPALACPVGFNSDGLPLSLQIVGKPFEEGLILRIAHTYQQMTDWHRREIAG